METHKLNKEAEKIMKEIDGLEVDNDVKRRTANMIVEQTRIYLELSYELICRARRVVFHSFIQIRSKLVYYKSSANCFI